MKAGLVGFRLHDLRHSFATVGVDRQISLYVVGKILGHRDSKTAQRYAHLQDDPLRRSADQISSTIAAAMKGEGAEVVEFSTRKR